MEDGAVIPRAHRLPAKQPFSPPPVGSQLHSQLLRAASDARYRLSSPNPPQALYGLSAAYQNYASVLDAETEVHFAAEWGGVQMGCQTQVLNVLFSLAKTFTDLYGLLKPYGTLERPILHA